MGHSMCPLDISSLRALLAGAQQDHDSCPTLHVVHAIAWTVIDSHFHHARADGFWRLPDFPVPFDESERRFVRRHSHPLSGAASSRIPLSAALRSWSWNVAYRRQRNKMMVRTAGNLSARMDGPRALGAGHLDRMAGQHGQALARPRDRGYLTGLRAPFV